MTTQSTPKKRTNREARATQDYLLQNYDMDVDTSTETILGALHRGENPLEFVGDVVDKNPGVEFYCGDSKNPHTIRTAKAQGYQVLQGHKPDDAKLRRGYDADHDVIMYRPKSVGQRVRAAEAKARATAQGKTFAHETAQARAQYSVNIDGNPYADD